MKSTITNHLSTKKTIPSLSENTFLRYLNFVALYVAQGIPEGMTLFGIPAWMAMNGKTPGEIGAFVAAFGLPWSFKIIVAPMMDRFTYLPMGRRRPWVLFGQIGLMISFIAMAFVPDPLNNLNLLMIAGFAVGFFGSFQDVATDGMAIDIVPIHQQARANGMMWGAKIIGTSASLAIGSWLINAYGFTTSILMLAVAVSIIMLAPLFLRERPGEKLLPWTKGKASVETQKMQLHNWSVIFKSLFKVFTLRNSLLLAFVLFVTQTAFNLIATLLPIFTVQELGWTNITYSQFFATASLIGGIGGMLIGGFLIDKFGKKRMLNIYFALLITINIALAFLQKYWSQTWFISGFMIIYQIFYVFTCIGLFANAMEFCWKKVSASQFTLYMTIGNLGRIAGAKLIGPIKTNFTWEYTILSFTIIFAIAWLIFQLIHVGKHAEKLNNLELKDSESLVPLPLI
ncbi:MAG: MFS transporter [Bacteroidetes bacterium]|nr:MFS transporter [Bacteroidota bacterium]MBK9414520.1 MFS transporter [Bacteroidota bacterium]MBL0033071.1 MFS transporter [Bacteroidota bacterium]MBP6656448.1 MFS transporter [Bacteroidia bacterium]